MNNRRTIIALLVIACSVLACSVGSPTSALPTIVAATLEALTFPAAAVSTAAPTQAAGIPVSFAGVNFLVPAGLGSGAAPEMVPAVNEQSGAPWEVGPAYTRFSVQGYPLENEFFQPQIMAYPTAEYANVNGGAATSIQRLQAILASPSAPLSNDALPRLPFANADQIIGAQSKIITFIGGQGVRVLAEYAQNYNPINNHELFYHFEGLTADGKNYIVATLPVNASFLAAQGDPAAALPAGGIPFPATGGTDATPYINYYQAVTDKLNSTSPEAFQPALTTLDTLIESLHVSP